MMSTTLAICWSIVSESISINFMSGSRWNHVICFLAYTRVFFFMRSTAMGSGHVPSTTLKSSFCFYHLHIHRRHIHFLADYHTSHRVGLERVAHHGVCLHHACEGCEADGHLGASKLSDNPCIGGLHITHQQRCKKQQSDNYINPPIKSASHYIHLYLISE